MTPRELEELKTGDVVKHICKMQSFVVTANYGNRVTAVQTVDITHADEWEIITKREVKTNGKSSG